LKIAGRIAFFTISSGYQPPTAKVATHPPRKYCVQYRETAFNFLSRLMEEEGIFYYFHHENGKHTLVLVNHSGTHKPCPFQPDVRMRPADGSGAALRHELRAEAS
jgi:type VI secretion system secreted protein VgrG